MIESVDLNINEIIIYRRLVVDNKHVDVKSQKTYGYPLKSRT
jgi:hypothetical protein